VIIVGLGGGALTKFSYRQLPSTRITTVEVNADVIAFGDLFDLPCQDSRMAVVHADAADYFATSDAYADVILLDGCDKIGIASTFNSVTFYENIRARLRPHGLLVLNLIGQSNQLAAHLKILADVFPNNLLVTNVSFSSNRIAFAFNDLEFSPDWEKIKSRANKLEQEHGLDFPRFARLLQRSHKRQASSGQW
jgi:spermidine synthase